MNVRVRRLGRRPGSRGGRVALTGGVLLALGLAGITTAWLAGPAGGGGPVDIEMRYSAFTGNQVTVRAGIATTFVLHNADPIDHEWLVGDAAFHERHRDGTEIVHGSSPSEVSVRAGQTVTTTVTFQDPGEYRFICHLPGHEDYGMVGVVQVVARD